MGVKRGKFNYTTEYKTLCNIRGDLQNQHIHYDPAKITTNAIDRGTTELYYQWQQQKTTTVKASTKTQHSYMKNQTQQYYSTSIISLDLTEYTNT